MDPAADVTIIHETANDRMKRSSEAWLPRSIVVAVLLHVALFTLVPDMSVADDYGANNEDIEVVSLPPLEIPPPPEQIVQPARPVVGSIDINEDVTIPSTSMDAWTPDMLAPPPQTDQNEHEGYKAFVPTMVAPRLLNPDEVERELRRTYPSMLRDAGISGDVDVNLWLDETGAIVKAEIGRSSGFEQFDEAALKVVDAMRLTPAQNRGRAVRVIVTLPVRFKVQ